MGLRRGPRESERIRLIRSTSTAGDIRTMVFSNAARLLPARRAMPAWRARRLVAARLRDLERPADFLTGGAMSTLCLEAQGSPARLHALLASALFLASTEDALSIDADLVRRAALSLGTDAPEPASARHRLRQAGPWVIGGVCALTALVLVLPMAQRRQEVPPLPTQSAVKPPPALKPVTRPSPTQRNATPPAIRTPPAPLPVPAVAVPVPAPRQAAAPVVAAPTPTRAEPAAPPVALPAGPPVEVLIRYRSGDKAAEYRARAIVLRLADANVKAELRPGARVGRTAVTYFYQEDRALAERIAAGAREGLPAPQRENPFDGRTLAYPGTIELALP